MPDMSSTTTHSQYMSKYICIFDTFLRHVARIDLTKSVANDCKCSNCVPKRTPAKSDGSTSNWSVRANLEGLGYGE